MKSTANILIKWHRFAVDFIFMLFLSHFCSRLHFFLCALYLHIILNVLPFCFTKAMPLWLLRLVMRRPAMS